MVLACDAVRESLPVQDLAHSPSFSIRAFSEEPGDVRIAVIKGKHNARNGNPYPAWVFVEAVHHAVRHCPAARRFHDRKLAPRNGAPATRALAAKWTKAAYYYDPPAGAF